MLAVAVKLWQAPQLPRLLLALLLLALLALRLLLPLGLLLLLLLLLLAPLALRVLLPLGLLLLLLLLLGALLLLLRLLLGPHLLLCWLPFILLLTQSLPCRLALRQPRRQLPCQVSQPAQQAALLQSVQHLSQLLEAAALAALGAQRGCILV